MDQRLRSRLYFTQYCTLVLIILTFVAGAFTKHKIAEQTAAVVPPISVVPPHIDAEQPPVTSISEDLSLEEVFTTDFQVKDQSRYDALEQVLLNHDVILEISITGTQQPGTALINISQLLDSLVADGVPANALRVKVSRSTDQNPKRKIQAHWFKETPGEAV